MQQSPHEYTAGVRAAQADLVAGRLVYQWIGHAGHWGHWIVRELHRRFGVGVSDGFGVCFTSEAQQSFADGYNATLAAEVNRRHGDGAFEAVFADAKRQTEADLYAARDDVAPNDA